MASESIAKRIEDTERSKGALKFRLTLFFVFFFISIFGTLIITSAMQVNTITRYICEQLAMPTVERALALIDGDAFERLSESLDPEDPYYRETQRRLYALKIDARVAYLYTMTRKGPYHYQYIIDGSDVVGGPEFSELGVIEDVSDYDEAFFNTLEGNVPRIGELNVTDRWGALLSVYAPVFNSAGEAVGLLGCDLDGSGISGFIRRQTFWQFGVVGIFTLIGLLVYLGLMKAIDRMFTAK